MPEADLNRLFNPETLAMIGASSSPIKWGNIILANILNGKYKGCIFPVNPRENEIQGLKCYPSVESIPHQVDVALITTPAAVVPGLIEACGRKGIPNVVVVTSDFSETGPEGAELEREIIAIAHAHDMRIVGPNTMGIFSAEASLTALMPPVVPLGGPVSMVSQSGNIGSQMLMWGADEGIGYEKFVSSGNEGDLTCIDYIRYFGDDPATNVILAYLEGVEENSDLLATARSITLQKPIVVFKGGRTDPGGRAAASHSGAMAGSTRIYKAVFRQAGMVGVRTSQGLIDCAKAFSTYPVPSGNRVGILTLGGGWGVITTDLCAENGLEVPDLPEEIKAEFDQVLPRYWSRGNPIDMVAVVDFDLFDKCLEILAKWDGIDAILALNARPSISTRELVEQTGKPVILVSLGPNEVHKMALTEFKILSFPTPERAVRTLRHMTNYGQFLKLSGY